MEAGSTQEPGAPGTASTAAASIAADAEPVGARLRSLPLRAPVGRIVSLAWIPLVASAISVVLSLASIYVSTRQPEVLVLLPDVVRVAGGHVTGASYIYLQPVFVSTGSNERVEVIRDMTLGIRGPGDVAETPLDWREQVQLVTDDGVLSYRHAADAVPLLIGPRNAADPIALFQGPPGWFVRAGTWDATLTATRVVGSDPLVVRFSFSIAPGDLPVLDDTTRERFLTYPVTPSS